MRMKCHVESRARVKYVVYGECVIHLMDWSRFSKWFSQLALRRLRRMVLRIVVNERITIIKNAVELCRAVRGITDLLSLCRINTNEID